MGKISIVGGLLPFALAVGLGLLALKGCSGPNPAYWIEKGKYDQLVAESQAQHAADLKAISEQNVIISGKNTDIKAKQDEIDILKGHSNDVEVNNTTLVAENATLRKDAATAIAANPALQKLVANFDLQIKGLTDDVFTLKAIIKDKDAQLADKDAKFNALAVIAKKWEGAYNTEHQLRLADDVLRIRAEKTAGHASLLSKVEGGVVVPLLIYTAINVFKKS